ncbi:hypothetical protein CWATWH0003_5210 [Crocosphaera watsonii WH 0003]|uniref:Uncharacterized protein n=2 Tax=Crocosphaera watsonii TaxID=263511 RepID=G5JCQ9_CROWT|nr:hypothetical protein CWATWH0003_5210 [Crocosphaera watsonii WH 0003]CCQ56028.1 hypothetical protein CWATWH0005_3836 [Crocosphaera watsonii WH 0005]
MKPHIKEAIKDSAGLRIRFKLSGGEGFDLHNTVLILGKNLAR